MRVGSKVTWKWQSGHASGKILEKFERKVSRTLEGTKVTRNGSADDPALLIESEDGEEVLKLQSEVESAG